MAGPSKRSWTRWGTFGLVLASLAAAIGLGVWYFRPRPLLSPEDPPELSYQKIIDAYGGEEALERWKTGRLEYEVEYDFPEVGKWSAHFQETFQLPGKLRREMVLTLKGSISKTVLVADGKSLWTKDDKQGIKTFESNPYQEAHCVEIVRGFHPKYLLNEGKEMYAGGVTAERSRVLDLVLKVPYGERELRECRVDVHTAKVSQFFGPILLPAEAGHTEVWYRFSDYKSTPGGPVPHRMIADREGRTLIDLRFTLIDLDTPIDPNSFAPPRD
jgi:hypothetical protein